MQIKKSNPFLLTLINYYGPKYFNLFLLVALLYKISKTYNLINSYNLNFRNVI